MRRSIWIVGGVAVAAGLAACAAGSSKSDVPLTLVPNVDLARFAGDWYVIAVIPTALEKGSVDAKESYALRGDGTIGITYSYRGEPGGPVKTLESKRFPEAARGNAVWGVQFVWPIKADYRVSYLSADYSTTMITREKRDHVWIMARTPTLPEAEIARLTAFVASQGYDVSKLVRVPQSAGKSV